MPLFKRTIEPEEERADINEGAMDSALLSALLSQPAKLTPEVAMAIPAVAACVNLICNTVAMVPFRLYKVNEETRRVEETNDYRERLVNIEPGDTLDGVQMKRALTRDYLLGHGGYIYIDKYRSKVRSLRYVDAREISYTYNADPIFKDYNILVQGKAYRPDEFLKVLRNTDDGYTGDGIPWENSEPLNVALAAMRYQQALLSTGGNKRGFLKTPKRLTAEAIKTLKDAWSRMYSGGTENVVVLNEGMEFQEASETSVEMELTDTIKSLSDQVCEIFGVPKSMISGGATAEDKLTFIQYCIAPILSAFENALNRDLLLEKEKGGYKWAADTTEFTKADILKRYEAYQIASKNGFMQIDEIRFRENLEPLGLDFVKLGLQDVLYYPDTELIFNPNMNQIGGVKLAMEDREAANKEAQNES